MPTANDRSFAANNCADPGSPQRPINRLHNYNQSFVRRDASELYKVRNLFVVGLPIAEGVS